LAKKGQSTKFNLTFFSKIKKVKDVEKHSKILHLASVMRVEPFIGCYLTKMLVHLTEENKGIVNITTNKTLTL